MHVWVCVCVCVCLCVCLSYLEPAQVEEELEEGVHGDDQVWLVSKQKWGFTRKSNQVRAGHSKGKLKKNVPTLVVRPLRPYHPPPFELSGHRNFFEGFKKVIVP